MDVHPNLARSLITNDPGTGGTTFSVTTGEGDIFEDFPFNVLVWPGPVGTRPTRDNAEVARITGQSTDDLTATRHVETWDGSAARDIEDGYQIAVIPTQQTFVDIEDAIASVVADLATHEARVDNPHSVTKTQVGLGNVDNAQQQPLNAILTDFASVTQAANKIVYFDSGTTAATSDLTAFARTLLDDANAAAAIATLGLDSSLASFVLPDSTTITAFGADLVDSADAAAARSTLGLGALATLGSVSTSQIDAAAVTFDKFQDITTGTVLGRTTTANGDVEEITPTRGLEMPTGTGLGVATEELDNLLINGGFDVWERGPNGPVNQFLTYTDDTYGPDRWNLLSEANSANSVSQQTDVPAGVPVRYSLKMVNVTANNQSAIVQFLEAADAQRLKNQAVSLSFYAKTTGTAISNLRAAILSWGSTADVITSDIIGTWAQGGNNPTWATNWTLESTPANFGLTSSWQLFKVENVLVDASTVNNVAVIIWVDDGTITSTDDYFVAAVKLNMGATATPYQSRPYAKELQLCQRYYENAGDGLNGWCNNSTTAKFMWNFKVQKRANPTLILLDTTPSIEETGSAGRAGSGSAIAVQTTSLNGGYCDINGFSGMGSAKMAHITQANMLAANAEL